jgi:type VI secretion system protein ImpK
MDRINEVTQDCFAAALQLTRAEGDALPAPEQLHQRLRAMVDELIQRANRAHFSHQDQQDIAYPLVALLDEILLGKPEPHKDYWFGNMLQFHFFQENQAGDGFFTRLQTVRQDPQRAEVLRVYYLCLLFGFQGRYRIRGGELELMNLIESLQMDLARARQLDSSETLSPNGKRPQEGLGGVKKTVPLLLMSAGILALALLVFGGLRVALGSSTSSVGDVVTSRIK